MTSALVERVDLEIGGMTCAACATRIERKLNKLEGVEATVNYATEGAAVRFDPGRIGVEKVIAAVEAIGYGAALPRAATDVSQDDAAESVARWLRRRLLVAAVLSTPLTVLAMAPPLQFSGWEWLALALAAPVVLFAGWPFHRAAALNLRHGAATMDTLISIGTLAALSWSAVVLFAGLDEHTYFEVAAVITTLILVGRYLEARARRSSGAAIRALLELGAKEARLLRDGEEVLVPATEVEVGDLFAYLASPRQTPILASSLNAADFFNGSDLNRWRGSSAVWQVQDGEVIGRGKGTRPESLVSEMIAENFRFTAQIQIRGEKATVEVAFGESPKSEPFRGYSLSLGGEAPANLFKYDGAPESIPGKTVLASGKWHLCEIIVSAAKTRVSLNGAAAFELPRLPQGRRQTIGFYISGENGELRVKDLKLEITP